MSSVAGKGGQGSPGYRLIATGVEAEGERGSKQRGEQRERSGPCDEYEARSDFVEQLVLLGGGRYVAVSSERVLRVYRIDLDGDERDDRPVAAFELRAGVRQLAARFADGRLRLVAALANRSLVEIDFCHGRSAALAGKLEPKVRTLLQDVGGVPRALVCTPRSTLVVIEETAGATLTLISLDALAGRAVRRGRLPFANATTFSPIHPQQNDLLVVIDARHGAHVVGFPTTSDDETLQVTRIDADTRATAIIALDDQWLAVARKGGEVVQVRATSATGGRGDAAAELCRRLRAVLGRCGCACHDRRPPPSKPPCRCCAAGPSASGEGEGTGGGGPTHGTGMPGGGRPGGGRPGGGITDDEPCRTRKRASLTWTATHLHRAGSYLVAVAAGGKRLAVLDRELNVLFERYLGARGSMVATGSTSADRLVTRRRGRMEIEAWSLDSYVRATRAVDVPAPARRKVDPRLARPVVFRGQQARAATPNPHLKVCVFTVTEPGQPFGDPDQGKMHALLVPNVYGVCEAYYRENSFNTLTTEFQVFGVHIGSARAPLVLPRSFASYFYDEYRAGGIEATMPGNWGSPPTFDGTEAMTLRTDPALGTGKDYAVPFAALWTTRSLGAYPVQVNFGGTETVQLQVVDGGGATHSLNLSFGATTLTHLQGDDEGGFLAALGTLVTNAIRAAETAAGIGVVLDDVTFRRIRSSTDDTQFGRLQGQIRIASGGTQKGQVTLIPPGTVPAALTAIGFSGANSTSGRLTSAAQTGAYLGECVHAARFDAGEGVGLNDPQLAAIVERQEDVAAQTVRTRLNLTAERGGAGAEITLVASTGLTSLGWSAAVPIPGSESTSNNRNTMRYHQDLANDVFTAAMNHLRASGSWDRDAVQAQFSAFDAMMIGFVGACPTTVPVTDRWSSSDAADFGRLRMFVRYHQAEDLDNPDAGEPPVTMGTSLLIGQRFNQFDPGVMSHEIGHGLELPDLYSATGFRDDVEYIDDWCQMAGGNSNFNHFCAWSKWSVGWIVEDPGDPALSRVIDVPMPGPSGQTSTEGWLCPVEYWDDFMRADIIAEVGSGLPIGQMMKVALGSDGGVVDLIELRARGLAFSQRLPPTPAVVVTNVLQPGTDRRWAVNGLYRRSVHLLNGAKILRAVGDRFDFASSPEFPVKGTIVELLELRTIRAGAIPIARVRVIREAAEFIDLYFQDNVPSWRSPDIWVDWAGDNPDPNVPRTYPEGTPTDQGETVRFPSSGTEKHFLVVRPHNMGNVHAEDVKVRWFICDPPGAGDEGRWIQRDTQTLPLLDAGTWQIAPFIWNVDSGTNDHQCIRAELIDWTIPAGVDPATGDTVALGSDDVRLQNNNAQKNVFDFEAAT
jgi:M6 family metalloprotease-like protein